MVPAFGWCGFGGVLGWPLDTVFWALTIQSFMVPAVGWCGFRGVLGRPLDTLF